jgi:DNA repair protein RecO (recombination protein O)
VSRSAKVRAIVLRTVDYGERDRIVTLLTRERGKLSAFARGARASRRRFAGVLEPFHLLSAEIAERGGDLWSLESASVEEAFGGVRGDLLRIACASYAVELAAELVRDAQPHEDLFDTLHAYLGRLGAAAARPWDLRAFELHALRAAGLEPALDACARCGEPPGEGPARFDPAQGGVLCPACRGTASQASLDAPADALAALLRLRSGADVDAPAPVAAAARRILGAHVEHHLGKRLASRRFLDEVAPLASGG